MSAAPNSRNLPNNGHAPLSAEEYAMRLTSTQEARASVCLEGFGTPPELDAIDARYVAGEFNDAEFEIEYMKFVYGKDWRPTDEML